MTNNKPVKTYFVYLYPGDSLYKAYSSHNYDEPEDGDWRCYWKGTSYQQALEAAKEVNRIEKEGKRNANG